MTFSPLLCFSLHLHYLAFFSSKKRFSILPPRQTRLLLYFTPPFKIRHLYPPHFQESRFHSLPLRHNFIFISTSPHNPGPPLPLPCAPPRLHPIFFFSQNYPTSFSPLNHFLFFLSPHKSTSTLSFPISLSPPHQPIHTCCFTPLGLNGQNIVDLSWAPE